MGSTAIRRRLRVGAALLARLALVAAAAALPLRGAAAQVGSTTDIITGRVTGPDGQPLAGAQVEVTSAETQVKRTRVTNDKGQYTIVFPDGGGQYQVVIRYLGMAPVTLSVVRQADEDRLIANARLSSVPQQLATVQVRAARPVNANAPTAGSTERVLTPEMVARLPVDASDLNELAALTPGVVPISATDTSAAGFSVAGQRPDLNSITLDGLSFGSTTVPQEAVRVTRVITNTYDVARGQFTGGQVATTTRGGTNIVQGQFNYSLRDPSLEWTVDSEPAFSGAFQQHQLSGGLGGPFVKNKLFGFGSFDLRRRTDDLPSLLAATGATLDRLGVDPAAAAEFEQLVLGYGLPPVVGDVPSDRVNDNATALARVDYILSEAHTLTLRGDWRGSWQGGSRVGALSLPHTGGDQRTGGGGGMVTLTSHLGNFINELRSYLSTDWRDSDPYIAVPDGRVRVTSILPDSTRSVSTLSFGGNPGLPQTSRTNGLETTDELSFVSPGGAHRFKLGGLLSGSRFRQDQTTNRLGTFTFDSLAAFEANEPSSYTRSLGPDHDRRGQSLTSALYFADTWRVGTGPQVTYGLRLEGSTFDGAPRYNAIVDTLFARRTDRFPSDVRLSPRVGFTWILGGADNAGGPGGRPGREGRQGRQGGQGGQGAQRNLATPTVIRGGFGEFRGRTPTSLYSAAQDASGLPSDEVQLVCVGNSVPTPDWADYLLNPAAIPTACADVAGQPDQPPGPAVANRRPSVTVFDPDFAAPRSWRASLGAQRRLLDRFSVNVDATYSRGVSLYGVRDLNLVSAPRFRLAEEGGRPVYVPAQAIVDSTGALSLFASRQHPQFAQVYEINSGLHSETGQLTIGLSGFTRRGMVFSTSYTWNRSRDQSSFSCCSAAQGFASVTTAGDPNQTEWGTSDFERRHAFMTTVTFPVKPWLELTSVGRLTSGQPYTPRVGGDINGDGARNDRAFIFSPGAATDTAVANGMQRLLDRASPRVRECLTSQLGQVAGRNSCSSPWTPSLDLRANVRPQPNGLGKHLMISLIAVNPLAGLDELIHGNDDLHGWGQPARPDPTLLYVRGFDPARNAFIYEVNERFGDTRASRNAFRAPFMLALQARWMVGPDRQREQLQALIRSVGGGGAGGFGGRGGNGFDGGRNGQGGAGGAGGFRNRLLQAMPNPVDSIIARRDSLALSDDQVARLKVVADSLRAKNDSLSTAVSTQLEQAAAGRTNSDPQTLFAQLRPAMQAGRANVQHALTSSQQILTPEQWAKLPESVKNPFRRLEQRAPGLGGPPRK